MSGSDQESEQHRAVASLLLGQGRPEEAIARLESAVEMARSAGDAAGEGAAELLLCQAYRVVSVTAEEQVRLARLHAERAEAAFRRAGDRAGLIEALSWVAVLYNESKDYVNVGYTLAKLEELDPRVAGWVKTYTDAVMRMFPAPQRAAELFRQAIDSVDVLPRDRDHWRDQCVRKLAFITGQDGPASPGQIGEEGPKAEWGRLFGEAVRLALRTDDEPAMERAMEEAIHAAEEMRRLIRSEVKQRELSREMDPMYAAKAAMADRAGRHREALDTIELNTSRSLLSRAALRALWDRSPNQSWERLREANDRITDCLVRYPRTRGAGEWKQLQLALRRRREASHWVQEQLVRLVPPPHELFLPSSSASLQDALGEKDAVVVFSEHGWVYVVQRSGVSKVATIDMEEVGKACERYRALATSFDRPARDDEPDEVGATIAEACLEPLATVLREVSRVLIVPWGRLWSVPLASLGRQPLTETHAVGIVPNLSFAAQLVKQVRPTRRVERFVGVGNPDETLPGAAEEVQMVARHFDEHAVVVGSSVDFSDTLIRFLDADVIHLACHGVSFLDYPELSYLHIAGPPEAPVPWFAEDVLRISMAPRLVVLSACDAGTSVALPGNEYVGFPGVFLVAGARTIVAPLWAIPDDATAILMDAFHQESRQRSPSRALRAAQEVLRAEPATAHPFYWAGFEVFGLP